MPNSETSQTPQTSSHTFQVDLRGLVDLFSHHLYSSPRVYLRVLLQNATDAITARQARFPGAPATITIRTGDTLTVTDTGIGLSEADVHTFLATIGRSSKRAAEGELEARAVTSSASSASGCWPASSWPTGSPSSAGPQPTPTRRSWSGAATRTAGTPTVPCRRASTRSPAPPFG